MKFGQLIEYNMRNIFLEKSYTKCGGETFPDPFLKIQNWEISGSTDWNTTKLFLFYIQNEVNQNKLKLRRLTLFYLI